MQGHKNCVLQMTASSHIYPSWKSENFWEMRLCTLYCAWQTFPRSKTSNYINATWILSLHSDPINADVKLYLINKYMHYLFIVSITYYINLQRCFIWLITQATCIALSVLFTLSSPFSVRRCLTTRLLQILKNRSIWKLKLFNCMFKIISICKTISRAIG